MTGTGARAAVEWLVSVAPDPAVCRWEWERSPLGVALLPAGRRWDVLILPRGLAAPTLAVLRRFAERLGPVLAGPTRVGFFVPTGTSAHWLGTGIRNAGDGSWIAVPYPGRAAARVHWLIAPDGSGTLNDPWLLEASMHEAVAATAANRS
ncbi:hypothetical protein [Streptomyces sp. NPDC059176]|uniref:hypothetical protein n=1 Tax=unclassified Streptomyces TaxID=2593676 RepID=UPI0036AAAA26